ncbi:hypothetical protein MPDQ_005701, partial [Monascus purpureus]
MIAEDVTFDPSNMYSNNPEEKARIIDLVISQAPAGAVSATVVNGWQPVDDDYGGARLF